MMLLSVGGCVTTRTVGDFAVSGTVVDKTTGETLEGAEVVLHYYARSNLEVDNKFTDPVVSDSDGKIYLQPPKIRLCRGIGPLS